MRLVPFSVLLLLVTFPVIAAGEDENQFNEAYRAYTAAIESGDTELEISSAKAALDVGSQINDVGDEQLAALMHNYGFALVRGDRIEEGRDVIKQSIDALIESTGKHNPDLITYYFSLAIASAGIGNERRQLRWYKRALGVASKNFGKKSIRYANLAFDAGVGLYQGSKSTLGEKYLKQSLEIYEQEIGAASKEAGLANYQLGRIAFYRGDSRKVTQYLLDALNAFEGDGDDEQAQRLIIHALLVQAYESLDESDNATKHCVAIGKENQFSPDQDVVPLFRLRPQYPHTQLRKGVEGYVDLRFTIDENGFVRDPEVVESSTGSPSGRRSFRSSFRDPEQHRSFEAAALAALERYRYAPRFVDGNAVPVEGVDTRVYFKLVD